VQTNQFFARYVRSVFAVSASCPVPHWGSLQYSSNSLAGGERALFPKPYCPLRTHFVSISCTEKCRKILEIICPGEKCFLCSGLAVHSQGGFSIDSISPPKPGVLRKNNRKMSLPDVIFECKMHENVFVGGTLT